MADAAAVHRMLEAMTRRYPCGHADDFPGHQITEAHTAIWIFALQIPSRTNHSSLETMIRSPSVHADLLMLWPRLEIRIIRIVSLAQ